MLFFFLFFEVVAVGDATGHGDTYTPGRLQYARGPAVDWSIQKPYKNAPGPLQPHYYPRNRNSYLMLLKQFHSRRSRD